MRGRDLVVLEEPPLPGFREMLDGSYAVDRYVEENAFEFPAFTRLGTVMASSRDT
jgi:hypothetical protein